MEKSLAEMKVVMEKWRISMHWGKRKVLIVSRMDEEWSIIVEEKD